MSCYALIDGELVPYDENFLNLSMPDFTVTKSFDFENCHVTIETAIVGLRTTNETAQSVETRDNSYQMIAYTIDTGKEAWSERIAKKRQKEEKDDDKGKKKKSAEVFY